MDEHKGKELVVLSNATLRGVVGFVEWQRGRWYHDETTPIQICYTNDYLSGRAWWHIVRKGDEGDPEKVAIGRILAVAIYSEGKQATKLFFRSFQASEQFDWGVRKLVQAFKEMGYVVIEISESEKGQSRPIPKDVRERREEIKQLYLDGRPTIREIAWKVSKSEATVKRDIRWLKKTGQLS